MTAWYAASAFTLIVAVTVLLLWALVQQLGRDKDLFLADEVRILRGYVSERPSDAAELKREVEWESPLRKDAEIFVRIVDERGRLLAETPGMAQRLPPDVFPLPVGADEEPHTGQVIAAGQSSFQVAAAAARLGTTDATFALQVAVDRTEEDALLAEQRRRLFLVLGAAFVICAAGGYGLAQRGIRPVRDIAKAMQRIHSTTLDERIATAGLPAELAQLALTFNEMLDRLEESFARLSRFSADIAHELRTPLANLRGETEVALRAPRTIDEYQEVLGGCLEQCDRLSRLVNSLLFLARAESESARIAPEPVDVGRELRALRDFYDASAADARIKLDVETPDEVVADLDRTLFQQAIGNLVENALAHMAHGGRVVLRLEGRTTGFSVEVADTGHGIPGEHLQKLFDRFYRVDPSRTAASGGTGLGLAIVKSVVELHGGAVTVESVVGEGTSFTLDFPAKYSVAASPPVATGLR